MPSPERPALLIDLDTLPPVSREHLTERLREAVSAVPAPARVVVVTGDAASAAVVRAAGLHADVRTPQPDRCREVVTSVAANLARSGHQVHLMSARPELRSLSKVSVHLPRHTWSAHRALLVDLENLGLRTGRNTKAFLAAIVRAAGGVDVVIAAAARSGYAAYESACAELGVTLVLAQDGPNGADKALLAVSRDLHRRGYTSFVVASADHYLARVPGDVTVALPSAMRCSRKLTTRAMRVLRF